VSEPLVVPLGDCALFVRVAPPTPGRGRDTEGTVAARSADTTGGDPHAASRALVLALRNSLEAAPLEGSIDVVPSFDGVAVHFDRRGATDSATWAARTDELLRRVTTVESGRAPRQPILEIAVRYGGDEGPDLDDVAALAGIDAAEVVKTHASTLYHVAMIGFVPGFPYLSGLPERLHTPRLTTPRRNVPRGSVAIGGSHTGIYPFETAGGWRIIGRTDAVLFDPAQDPPAMLRVGDRVRFVESVSAQ
jgi:KipI family sensor histidine kinase inhibitor